MSLGMIPCLQTENSVALKGHADFGICLSKFCESPRSAASLECKTATHRKFRFVRVRFYPKSSFTFSNTHKYYSFVSRIELQNSSHLMPLVVRRVIQKPALPLFDVYLERCGRWGDTNLEEESQPNFSALVPMAVANQVVVSFGVVSSRIVAAP